MMQATERKRILLITALAIVVCTPSLIWLTMPLRDSSLYALLTAEFSRGNFAHAYNADYAPLLTTLGGIINYFIDRPFLANQIASVLLFLPGIPGTYLLARDLRGPKVAYIAAILYAFCPYTIELATSGGIDSGKLGFMPWLAWATYNWCRDGGIGWGLMVGLIGAALSYARGEGVLFVVLALFMFVLYSLWKRFRETGSPLTRPLLSFFAALCVLALATLPWVAYETNQTGYVVTHSSQIMLYRMFDHVKNAIFSEANASPLGAGSKDVQLPESSPEKKSGKPTENIPWLKNVEKSTKGLYIPFLMLAVLGTLFEWRRKRTIRARDFFPLAFIGLNFAIFFPTNVCTSRYFQSTIPLYLHLAALGVLALGTILTAHRWFTPGRIKLLACVSLVVFALLGQKECDFFKSHAKLSEDKTLMHIGHWISSHRGDFPFYGTLANSRVYHNGRFPIILSADFRIAYYARSDCIIMPRDFSLTPADMVDFCRRHKISLILYDRRLEEFCPGFGAYWRTDPAFYAVDSTRYFPENDSTIQLLVFDDTRTGKNGGDLPAAPHE